MRGSLIVKKKIGKNNLWVVVICTDTENYSCDGSILAEHEIGAHFFHSFLLFNMLIGYQEPFWVRSYKKVNSPWEF